MLHTIRLYHRNTLTPVQLAPHTCTHPSSYCHHEPNPCHSSCQGCLSYYNSPNFQHATSFKSSTYRSFSTGEQLVPIPAKLVQRIQKLEFVDLRELLPDNLALSEKLEALCVAHASNPEQWEITKIVTWTSCMATYIASVAAAHPERVRDMLAYMHLLVREGHKYGSSGWLKCDLIFRKNNSRPSARWDHLDPSQSLLTMAILLASPAITVRSWTTQSMTVHWPHLSSRKYCPSQREAHHSLARASGQCHTSPPSALGMALCKTIPQAVVPNLHIMEQRAMRCPKWVLICSCMPN